MADFAVILTALDQMLGTGGFTRFTEQAKSMAEDSLSSDPFLAALDEEQVEFIGTAAELLTKVTPDRDGWRPPRDWTKHPRTVTTLLKRNAPALRKAGWVVEDDTDRDHFTVWTVAHPEKVRNSSPPNPPSPHGAEQADQTDQENAPSQDDSKASQWWADHEDRCSRCGYHITTQGHALNCRDES